MTQDKSPRTDVIVDPSIALYNALADTKLHQPCPPQGSGHDWLLSSTSTSNWPAVVGVVVVSEAGFYG